MSGPRGPALGPIRAAALVAFVLFLAFRSWSAAADGLVVDGHVAHPQSFTPADLASLPATTVEVTFQTGHGQESGSYTGVLLWTLMQRVSLADSQGNRPDLRHTLTVTGRDGYAVAIAFGEIDPDFEGKSVIVANRRDGSPLDPANGLRLIVPGDKHGGRDVRDVVRITVN